MRAANFFCLFFCELSDNLCVFFRHMSQPLWVTHLLHLKSTSECPSGMSPAVKRRSLACTQNSPWLRLFHTLKDTFSIFFLAIFLTSCLQRRASIPEEISIDPNLSPVWSPSIFLSLFSHFLSSKRHFTLHKLMPVSCCLVNCLCLAGKTHFGGCGLWLIWHRCAGLLRISA